MWGEQKPLGTKVSSPLPQGQRKVWLLGLQLLRASGSTCWTLFSMRTQRLQQSHTALIDSQTVALWLVLVYAFNFQLQKSLLSFCLNLLRPRPVICAFKLALLISKVLKLSLGKVRADFVFLLKELAKALVTKFSSSVPLVQGIKIINKVIRSKMGICHDNILKNY